MGTGRNLPFYGASMVGIDLIHSVIPVVTSRAYEAGCARTLPTRQTRRVTTGITLSISPHMLARARRLDAAPGVQYTLAPWSAATGTDSPNLGV